MDRRFFAIALVLAVLALVAVAAIGSGTDEREKETPATPEVPDTPDTPDAPEEKHTASIVLDRQSMTLQAGEYEQASATVTPSDSSDKVEWSTSDRAVATVSLTGYVYGKSEGTATITATSGGCSASLTVTVTKAPTTGEKNALKRALSYLEWNEFSEKGLYEQLLYEKFSETEARYGVDHCGADWQEQADKKAKSYLTTSRFSEAGLVNQLVRWEDFTEDQARLAVSRCGADWDEQAVLKAKEMMQSSYGYSRDGILYDMVHVYLYTQAQADKAVAEVWPQS